MSEYKEKKIHRTIRLPNFYEKIDLLDSLTYGGVEGGLITRPSDCVVLFAQ